MAKTDTVVDIKAANGAELNPDDYTQKELDTLLALAKDPAKKAEFDKQVAALKGSSTSSTEDQPTSSKPTSTTSDAPAEDTTGKIRVKVTASKGSGSYVHPVGKQLIQRGGESVLVPADEWTDQMIRDKYLTEVRK